MSGKSFFSWIESNLASIIVSILLALTVSIVATQEVNPVQEISLNQPIPVQIIGLQPGMIITNTPPRTVSIQVRAPQNILRTLSPDNFEAVVDLSELGPGIHQVPVDVEVFARARLVSVDPSPIRIEIEEARQREMPIQLVLDGSPPTGYRILQRDLDPASVIVGGPRSKVELISEVRATASIDGMRETLRGSLALAALDSDGNIVEGVTITPATVNVTVTIAQEEDFREVAVRVNGNFQPTPGYYVSRYTADPPLVAIRGEPDLIRDIRFVETQPITLQGLTEDTTINIQLNPPEGVTLEGTQTVEVRIFVDAQPGFKVLELPIRIIGLGSGLTANLAPDSVGVFLSGPLPVLEALNEQEDIIITVDLEGLGRGNYQREPAVQIVSPDIPAEELSKVLVESVLPTLIEVEILPDLTGGTR